MQKNICRKIWNNIIIWNNICIKCRKIWNRLITSTIIKTKQKIGKDCCFQFGIHQIQGVSDVISYNLNGPVNEKGHPKYRSLKKVQWVIVGKESHTV